MKKYKQYDRSCLGRFDDISSLFAHLQSAETTPKFRGCCASFDGDEEFCKSIDMDQADDWLLHGQPDLYVKMDAAARKISAAEGVADASTTRRTIVNHVAGNRLNYQAYMQGNPKCMYRAIRTAIKRPVVNIVYNSGATGGYSATEIIDAAMKVLFALIRIERRGIRTNLYAATISKMDNQFGGIILRVKDADQPLNVLKTAYPLCHASMLRRHKFRYIETCPSAKRGWVGGYGCSVNKEELVEALDGYMSYDACLTFYDAKWMDVEDIVDYILHNGRQ